jgi:Ras-related protein Rab-1A
MREFEKQRANFKIVLIGEQYTGKTSMVMRFADAVFAPDYQVTIALDFKTKSLLVDDKLIRMQIMDTAGQERFRSIS